MVRRQIEFCCSNISCSSAHCSTNPGPTELKLNHTFPWSSSSTHFLPATCSTCRTYFVKGSLEKGIFKHKLISSHIPGRWATISHGVYLSEMALQASLRKTSGHHVDNRLLSFLKRRAYISERQRKDLQVFQSICSKKRKWREVLSLTFHVYLPLKLQHTALYSELDTHNSSHTY